MKFRMFQLGYEVCLIVGLVYEGLPYFNWLISLVSILNKVALAVVLQAKPVPVMLELDTAIQILRIHLDLSVVVVVAPIYIPNKFTRKLYACFKEVVSLSE